MGMILCYCLYYTAVITKLRADINQEQILSPTNTSQHMHMTFKLTPTHRLMSRPHAVLEAGTPAVPNENVLFITSVPDDCI